MLARVISLLSAAAVLAVLVFYPRLVGETGAQVPFPFLVLTLFGMSFCWVHGFGFVPENRWLRILFSPWVAWPAVVLGSCLTIAH